MVFCLPTLTIYYTTTRVKIVVPFNCFLNEMSFLGYKKGNRTQIKWQTWVQIFALFGTVCPNEKMIAKFGLLLIFGLLPYAIVR